MVTMTYCGIHKISMGKILAPFSLGGGAYLVYSCRQHRSSLLKVCVRAANNVAS